MWLTVPILFFAIIILCLFRRQLALWKWRKFPGPSPLVSLPIIGHGHLLGDDPLTSLMEMHKKYGDVFRCDVGALPTVFLCKFDQAKEAYKMQAFTSRPYVHMPGMVAMRGGADPEGNSIGIAFTDGSTWKQGRQFFMRQLTDLGMGNKNKMGDIIEEEVMEFNELLRRRIDESGSNIVGVKSLFLPAVNNIIWRLSSGKRFSQTDKAVSRMNKAVKGFMESMDPSKLTTLMQVNILPVVQLFRWMGVKNLVDEFRPLIKVVDNLVAEATPDDSGFMADRYLATFQESNAKGTTGHWLHGAKGERQLRGGLQDLFLGGSDTTSTFLEWSILYLSVYPDIQERLFQEVLQVIGQDRQPCLSDRDSSPYCMAFAEEVARHSPETHLNVAHYTDRDVNALGYFFPKGTQVYAFHRAFNNDPDTFADPTEFRPERHLVTEDTEGKERRCHQKEQNAFFGVGNRRCPGEILARAEMFVFLASIIQAFRFRLPTGEKPDFLPINGVLFAPKPFDVVVETRV